jgi:hypothetical protein
MEVNDVTCHTESSPITFKVSTAKCVIVLKVLPVQTYNATLFISGNNGKLIRLLVNIL